MTGSFEQDIEPSLAALRTGGVILYPTDTIWGIGCDATDATAVERVFALKQRSPGHALIVLVAEERDVIQYVSAVDLSLFDYLDQLTRPTTVVYDGAVGLADNLLAADGSIGIRICQDTFCRTLIKRLRRPLVSTSANFSGQPAPASFADIDPAIIHAVDYTVNYRQQERPEGGGPRSSSVIRWKNGTVEILRP